ncbi:hypothetical protein [Maribellus luteus]|uniref:hypothetical protein n=1 Tax=Maribellus luteus TaxID=2305463 RepID=UPI0011C4A320|nr:hypothetical protein [Maribellus luteus]
MNKACDATASTKPFKKEEIKVHIHPFQDYIVGNTTDDFIHMFGTSWKEAQGTKKKFVRNNYC